MKDTQVKEDLKMYWEAMKDGNVSLALLIERRYGLDGYPPSIVSVGLNALAEGRDMGEAIDAVIGQ